MSRRVSFAACSEARVASAIIFLRVGDQVEEVALPACSRPHYTGTAVREAVLGTDGVSPNSS